MDVSRLNQGEKLAGAAGIALLLVMFIFTWFSFDVPFGDAGFNAWESFGLIDLILFVAAVAGITLAVVAASQSKVDLPVALSAITAGLGILAVVLIVFRILSPPDFGAGGFGVDVDADRGIGVFLGLIAAIGIAAGGWMAMQEEGTSFGDQAHRGGGGDEPPPPPAAPPPPPPPAQ